MPFAASTTMRSGRIDLLVDEGQHLLDEPRPDVLLADRAALPSGRGLVLEGAGPDLGQPGVAADRKRAATHDLDARVLLRVVGRRDAGTTLEPELDDGEVHHLRPDEPDVENLRAAVSSTLAERSGHRRR